MRIHYRKILTLFFVFNFLTIVIFNSAVLLEVIDEWWSVGPYNHGLLGFGLALYVFWTKKAFFASPHNNFLGLVALCLASILFLVANLASIGQLQVLSLSLIALALLISVYGFKILKTFSLPLLMILLSLPFWNFLQVPLRGISTWVSFHSVEILGYEIIRSGYNLITPQGIFVVEQSCSGLGFFLASALYAVFVAQINHLSGRQSIIFFIFAISVAIIANWIRITVIIIVGSQTAMQSFIVEDHLTFGWFVFAACFVPVIIIGNIYFGEQNQANNKPQKTINKRQQISTGYLLGVSAITLFFAITTLLLPARFDPKYKFTLPAIPPYTQLAKNKTASQNWHPISRGATSEEFNYFLHDEDLLQVYLANYARQRQGEEMIFVENSLFDKDRWFNVQQQTIPLNSSSLKQVNLITLKRDNQRSRGIAYWYLINGHYIHDKKIAKWHEVQAAIKGQPGATLIAISLDYKNKNEKFALKKLSDFVTVFSAQAINIKTSI